MTGPETADLEKLLEMAEIAYAEARTRVETLRELIERRQARRRETLPEVRAVMKERGP